MTLTFVLLAIAVIVVVLGLRVDRRRAGRRDPGTIQRGVDAHVEPLRAELNHRDQSRRSWSGP